eukprot:6460385-Alexandrium_andersonii.AAC.1
MARVVPLRLLGRLGGVPHRGLEGHLRPRVSRARQGRQGSEDVRVPSFPGGPCCPSSGRGFLD